MSDRHELDATAILSELARGDESAAARLLPLVYQELRALAHSYFESERSDHTLEPTALVHEAFVRLVDQARVEWRNRAHFFAVAATAMRRILTDHARKHRAAKRGGNQQRVPLTNVPTPSGASLVDLVDLDDALERLSTLDERQYRIVELRFFGGLPVEQVAEFLEVSKTTVENDWRMARAWLSAELRKADIT
ncbi:MAG: sigma-70 family RNA polymerase sigma factor [Phycisphaerales bacterium]|nr:MAG: sigma-70 family RNA polymerase sigma factor [Phycisphaerales bacterium]